MTWLLTAKSGSSRGESWTIGARPIVLGRSLSCDITIGDPTVSRKHCEVKLEGDGVVFRDLGSRNVSLVNGRAVERCRLLVGDELSLGTESFILTRTSVMSPPTPPENDPDGSTTISLDEASILREADDGAAALQSFPATVQDLVRLHHFGRKLDKASSVAEFAALCIQGMEEAFPARVKSAVCCAGANGLIWYPKGFTPSDDLAGQVSDAMTRGGASMSSFRAKRLFFREVVIAGVAPLMAPGRCLGALVIESLARDYVPEPGALAHLNALAQTASPYLGSLEYRGAATDGEGVPLQGEFATPTDNDNPIAEGIRESAPEGRRKWPGILRALDKPTSATEKRAVLEPLENAERMLIKAVLAQCNGDKRTAAEILGLPVSALEEVASRIERPDSGPR